MVQQIWVRVMSSGTYVKVGRYYNHHHYHSIAEIDEKIVEVSKKIEEVWARILSLCTATPRDITPQEEEPVQYINDRLEILREYLEDCDYQLQALHDIKEGWETREED